LKKSLKEAFAWDGFAFVEIRNYCFENNGRRIGFKTPYSMLAHLKDTYKIVRDPAPGYHLAENEIGIISQRAAPKPTLATVAPDEGNGDQPAE